MEREDRDILEEDSAVDEPDTNPEDMADTNLSDEDVPGNVKKNLRKDELH